MIGYSQKRRSPHVAGFGQRHCLGGQFNDTPSDDATQSLSDHEREQRIDALKLRLLAASTPDARRVAWNLLRDEIAKRSPAAIERLERARGLRAEIS